MSVRCCNAETLARRWILAGALVASAVAAPADGAPIEEPAPAAPAPDSSSAVAALNDSVAPPVADFGAFFSAFLDQRCDSSRVARVRGLAFQRDAGRFTLDDGRLWLATPVGGRVCAAVFEGRGSFTLTPPTPVERDQVRRAYGSETLARKFTVMVLLVADTTLTELSRGQAFRPERVSKAAANALGECMRFVSDRKTGFIGPSLARPLAEGRSSGYMFAMMDSGKAERLFFEIDPQRREEVAVWREPLRRHIGLWRVWRRDDVCMFARDNGSARAGEPDMRPALAVKNHRIECWISGSMGFSAVAEIECESREPVPQRWVTFNLYDQLVVDSAAWVGGPPARVFRRDDSYRFWVRCDPPLDPGETRTLRVRYHGPLIERVGDWMLLQSSTQWYPEPDGRHRAPFDVTFHSPSQYHLVSVGERVSNETRRGLTTSRWRFDRPIHNASFVLGSFEEERFGAPGAGQITALMFRGKADPIRVSFGDIQVVSGARMDRKVAEDAARAVDFFTRNLGPPPVSHIVLAEIPDTKGEAFPGLIQITWTPFRGRNVQAEDAVFRAHEVAHQWWGYGVDHRTYHDHWLSEGFADFSALWYIQQGLGDTKNYLAVLEAWRDQIVEDLSNQPSDAPPAGPIWLGYRSARVELPEDHTLIVYKKGAWVLHMLRNLMLDLDTSSDERFAGMMRDFYARHEGGTAGTEDFHRIAERYAGQKLGWFFDQWVYGTEIPSYRFAWRSERLADGRYKVTCRVEQSGVPATFRMPVLFRIDFDGQRSARVRHDVTGSRAEFELPLLQEPPRAVVFNDLQSVLCKVEQVKW